MTGWSLKRLVGGCVFALGCGAPTAAGPPDPPGPAAAAAAGLPVEAIERIDDAPPGSDGAPRMTLALRAADGTMVVLPEQASSYAPFRDGVALVDGERRLLLITPDGARRELARRSGAPPVAGPHGELLYVAAYALKVELHRLTPGGDNRVLAGGLGSAGALAPQPDGRVLFVGARNGGVAGLWIAGDERGARCLTNCTLRTGAPWGDRHVPLPRSPEAITLRDGSVEYVAADGSRQRVPLGDPASTAQSDAPPTPRVGTAAPEGATR